MSLGNLELRLESIRSLLKRFPATDQVASLARSAAQAAFAIERCRASDFGVELRVALEAKIERIEAELARTYGDVLPPSALFFR